MEKGSKKAIAAFQAGVTTSAAGGGIMRMSPPQMRQFTTDDGSFVLQIAPRCVADGDPLYLTAGGLDTCRTAPFERGGAAHLTLLGRSSCP